MIGAQRNFARLLFRSFSTSASKKESQGATSEVSRILEGGLQTNAEAKPEKKKNYARELKEDERPIPVSPVLGPITV
jgi:hypothetical protein